MRQRQKRTIAVIAGLFLASWFLSTTIQFDDFGGQPSFVIDANAAAGTGGGEVGPPPPPRPTKRTYFDGNITDGCECYDNVTGVAHNFCYIYPQTGASRNFPVPTPNPPLRTSGGEDNGNKKKTGQRFSCEFVSHLRRLGLLDTEDFVELDQLDGVDSKSSFPEPVFVTGSSDSHFSEQIRLIGKIQTYFPSAKIVVYDLGLKPENSAKLKSYCQTTYRAFNFHQYPFYVKNLFQYRWKPLIIAEALNEFRAIWWMDSSVVFKKNDLSHVYALLKCHNPKFNIQSVFGRSPTPPRPTSRSRLKHHDNSWIESGWHIPEWTDSVSRCHKFSYMLQGFTGHGIYPATHPGVYKYIPTDEEGVKRETAKMYEAGFLFTIRTPDTVKDVLKWYVLCALEEDCMAPPGGNLGCSWRGPDRFKNYAGCHRFDQSVVNLLLANRNAFDRQHYTSGIVDFFNIVRGAGGYPDPETCQAGPDRTAGHSEADAAKQSRRPPQGPSL